MPEGSGSKSSAHLGGLAGVGEGQLQSVLTYEQLEPGSILGIILQWIQCYNNFEGFVYIRLCRMYNSDSTEADSTEAAPLLQAVCDRP